MPRLPDIPSPVAQPDLWEYTSTSPISRTSSRASSLSGATAALRGGSASPSSWAASPSPRARRTSSRHVHYSLALTHERLPSQTAAVAKMNARRGLAPVGVAGGPISPRGAGDGDGEGTANGRADAALGGEHGRSFSRSKRHYDPVALSFSVLAPNFHPATSERLGPGAYRVSYGVVDETPYMARDAFASTTGRDEWFSSSRIAVPPNAYDVKRFPDDRIVPERGGGDQRSPAFRSTVPSSADFNVIGRTDNQLGPGRYGAPAALPDVGRVVDAERPSPAFLASPRPPFHPPQDETPLRSGNLFT